MIKFYQDHKGNEDQADDRLEYVMMLYKRDNTLINSDYHYDTQMAFPLVLAPL